MDEFERLEGELQKLYSTYIDKFRHLAFLEQQLDEQNRLEQERLQVRISAESHYRKLKLAYVKCNF
jgi:clusterin-associated protein 1